MHQYLNVARKLLKLVSNMTLRFYVKLIFTIFGAVNFGFESLKKKREKIVQSTCGVKCA